jgi:phosphoadenosine phosphosulfate reductase
LQKQQILSSLQRYARDNKKLFASSSFQTHSMVLLHIIGESALDIPVYFINTGYHFPETISYKEQMTKQLGLQVIDLYSHTPKNMQKDAEGRLLFTSDPDYCCYLNKTQPMEKILQIHDIWINGIRGDQNKFRSNLKVEEAAPHGSLRFHPMLDWSSRDIFTYIKEFNIPRHPLDAQGYLSIGCEPCTHKRHPDIDQREARWYGLNKTECGLHTDLIKKA